MKHRKLSELSALAERVADPPEYFRGVQRRTETPPDNVLLFVRRSAAALVPRRVEHVFHQRWVLLVALAGAGVVELDRRPVKLATGHAMLVPPLHLHGYREVAPRIRWLFVTFEWPGHTAATEEWVAACRLDAEARRRLWAMLDGWLDPQPDGALLATHLLELLRLLNPVGRATAPHGDDGSLVSAVQAAVRGAPAMRLAELAARVGISESHLRARFRAETGISLGRFLREARLREAALWLRDERTTVKEAAERAGYPDIFSFSRAYRRCLGAPPSVRY